MQHYGEFTVTDGDQSEKFRNVYKCESTEDILVALKNRYSCVIVVRSLKWELLANALDRTLNAIGGGNIKDIIKAKVTNDEGKFEQLRLNAMLHTVRGMLQGSRRSIKLASKDILYIDPDWQWVS